MPVEPVEGRTFVDSNVICYLFGSDPSKADRAKELLGDGPVVSVQVLAETCNVASRKGALSWPQIEEVIEVVTSLCEVVAVTAPIQSDARKLAAQTGYTIYDAQILAAAIDAGCACVWSEDMQDGHNVDTAKGSVLIQNPFLSTRGVGH